MRKPSAAACVVTIALLGTAVAPSTRCQAQASALPAAPAGSAIPVSPDRAMNLVWRIDAAVERRVKNLRAAVGPSGDAVARAGNWWGGPGVIVFAAMLWLGGRIAGFARTARVGLRGAEGLAVASALSGVIKGLAGRARPAVTPGEPWHWNFNHGWTDANYFSMPSGHTTATVAFAVAATVAAWSGDRRVGVLVGVAVLLSAVWVAWSRLYTDQHWFSDVIVGAALGATTSLAIARLHKRHPAAGYHRVMLGHPGTSR